MLRVPDAGCRLFLASLAGAGLMLAWAGPARAQAGQRDAVLMDANAAQLCVDTINSYRARMQLQPLARWVDGESAAAAQALADSRSRVPHGAIIAFEQTPAGAAASISQNECPGYPGPAAQVVTTCTAQMWAEGPGSDYQKHGHYLHLSNPAASKVACGFATAADGMVWATQNLTPYSAPLDPTHSRLVDLDEDNSRPVAAKFCLDSINSYRSSARFAGLSGMAGRRAMRFAPGRSLCPRRDAGPACGCLHGRSAVGAERLRQQRRHAQGHRGRLPATRLERGPGPGLQAARRLQQHVEPAVHQRRLRFRQGRGRLGADGAASTSSADAAASPGSGNAMIVRSGLAPAPQDQAPGLTYVRQRTAPGLPE